MPDFLQKQRYHSVKDIENSRLSYILNISWIYNQIIFGQAVSSKYMIIFDSRPVRRLLKRGCECKGFFKAGCESKENSDFEAKLGV